MLVLFEQKLNYSLFVNYPRFPGDFKRPRFCLISSVLCSIVICAKLLSNVYCPMSALSASYTDADCWCELLCCQHYLLAHTCPALKSHLFNSVCDSSSCPFTRKISTRFAQCSRSCFEVQLTVVEQKPSEQKAPVFPTRAFTSRSGRESASFCTWSLHLTEKLPNIWLNSRLKHNSNSFVDHISQSLNFLWLLRAQGNICRYLTLPQPQIGLCKSSLAVTSTANRAGKHFFEHESCFSRVFRDLCGLLFRQKW